MSNVDFIETDSGVILTTILQQLENGCSEPLYPGDERRIFGESALAPLFVSLFSLVNDSCRQKMLRYARGEVLDALGENFKVYRESPKPATTTLRFSIDEAISTNIAIPAGIRCTSDYVRYFVTDNTVVLQAGSTYVDVTATAETGGKEGNDIGIGEINTIVDISQIPLVDNVTNIVATGGGEDEESDDAYRERIRNSGDAISTAGPAAAYRYWAIASNPARISDAIVENLIRTRAEEIPVYTRSGTAYAFIGGENLQEATLKVKAHGSSTVAALTSDYSVDYSDSRLLIITIVPGGILASAASLDVEIEEIADGEVVITPVCFGGEIPTAEDLAAVLDTCSASDVRPLTDRVTVKAPDVEYFDIELVYYTTAADEAACIASVEGSGGAIDQYVYWQGSSLKRDINPDYLRKLILAPDWEGAVGATMVQITKPVYQDLPGTTLAKWSGNLTVSHIVKEGVN